MKFRKKPIIIEAIQWNGNSNKREIDLFVGKELKAELESETAYVAGKGAPLFSLIIETLEGNHKAMPNDWIIKGIKGEFYPCKPDIFDKTYEPAQSMTAPDGFERLKRESNALQQCLYGLNGALDDYWNSKHRGESQIKKINDWQQICLRELNKIGLAP